MKIVAIILAVLLVGVLIYFMLTPSGVFYRNRWGAALQEADDVSNYETLKTVEDTTRSMIASYNSDKLVYEQYKDSDSTEQRNWADQAKMRANRTASTYNDFVLKNSYVWKNGVPSDIYSVLPFIE